MHTEADNRDRTEGDAPGRIEWLEAENKRLEESIARLEHQVQVLQKALFGQRSERVIDPGDQIEFEEMLKELKELQDELADQQDQASKPPASTPDKRRRKPRRNLQDMVPPDLPREKIVIEPPPEERICPRTGKPMRRIGQEVVEKLAYRPGSWYIREYVYPLYASKAAPLAGVVQAARPDFAIPGGIYDESFIAGTIVDKCAYHLPLYRQAERLKHASIHVSRQTLSHLYIKASELLAPLFLLMKQLVLDCGVLFTDDTPVNLLVRGRGKTVTGRMWVYIGGGNDPPYRVFEFTPDRCKSRPKEFIGDFKGHIHADAYNGYDDLFEQDGITECACWMHTRRKFGEATDGPVELREEILRLIRMIYRYERVLKGKDDETIVRVRQERTGPIIDRIFKRTAAALTDGEVLPRSAVAGAIGYLHNRGDALRTFLSDARLKPDNGTSERAIRPLAIGRKNWMFVGSERGGDATGILLSLVQSCRAMGIDPFDYLTDVLRRINGHCANRLDELLPHNWQPADSYYD